jgi:hypothetical protein
LLRDLGFQVVAGQARLSSKIITIITSVTCVVSLNKSKVVANGPSSPFSLYTYEIVHGREIGPERKLDQVVSLTVPYFDPDHVITVVE